MHPEDLGRQCLTVCVMVSHYPEALRPWEKVHRTKGAEYPTRKTPKYLRETVYSVANEPLPLILGRAALGWTLQNQDWGVVYGSSNPEVMSKLFSIREETPSTEAGGRSWGGQLLK